LCNNTQICMLAHALKLFLDQSLLTSFFGHILMLVSFKQDLFAPKVMTAEQIYLLLKSIVLICSIK
jgi:hypothetical protein